MSGPKFMAPHAIVEVFYSKPKKYGWSAVGVKGKDRGSLKLAGFILRGPRMFV